MLRWLVEEDMSNGRGRGRGFGFWMLGWGCWVVVVGSEELLRDVELRCVLDILKIVGSLGKWR